MSKNKIVIDAAGLKAQTKSGSYCVTRRRLGDLSGKRYLPPSEYHDVFLRHETQLAQEADRTRRHGRADPTGLVTLDRAGILPVFGKTGKA